jgi:hypothetical protein
MTLEFVRFVFTVRPQVKAELQENLPAGPDAGTLPSVKMHVGGASKGQGKSPSRFGLLVHRKHCPRLCSIKCGSRRGDLHVSNVPPFPGMMLEPFLFSNLFLQFFFGSSRISFNC